MNSKKTKKQLKRGFTVLELLIVITIIGILFSIFIFSYKDYKERARLAKTMEWAHSIKSYLGAYAAGIWTLGIIQVNVTPDYSGQESDCTVYGATLSKGVSENGLIFDGADYVNCGDKEIFKLPKGEKITLELWFNSSVSQSAALIAKRKSGSTDLYGMFLYPTTISFYFRGSDSSGVNNRTISGNYHDGKWHHLVASYNTSNGGLKAYLDGVEKLSGIFTVNTNIALEGYLDFGAQYETGSRFIGMLDEIRIYKETLPQVMVKKHYVEGLKRHQNLTKK